MDLEELKKSMATLDDVLAQKGSDTLNFNTKTCTWAQSRIANQYWRSSFNSTILAVVFLGLWFSRADQPSFPLALKGFLGIYMAVAAIIYATLYRLIKKIRIASTTPIVVMKQVSSIRLYSLVAEIVLAIVLAIFFTLFLSNLWALGTHSFWLVAGALFVSLIIAAIMLPKKIRDFKALTALN